MLFYQYYLQAFVVIHLYNYTHNNYISNSTSNKHTYKVLVIIKKIKKNINNNKVITGSRRSVRDLKSET